MLFGELFYLMFFYIIKYLEGKIDISMRGRSFNFLVMVVFGILVLRNVNCDSSIEIIVVFENGYIFINLLFIRRWIGSYSIRIIYFNFLSRFEFLFRDIGFYVKFVNFY